MFFNNYFNTFLFVLLFVITLSAQQFTLEATIDGNINVIFDLDNDGICEYFMYEGEWPNTTVNVYSGSTHQIKYSNIDFNPYWGDIAESNNPQSVFPHIDFNGDRVRDIIGTRDSSVTILDLKNNQILFEFNLPGEDMEFRQLIDIDGNGELELIIVGYFYSNGKEKVKTHIFSTGVNLTNLGKNTNTINSNYKLEQNYPNPFNPSTTINYAVPKRGDVNIRIYDINGQMIKELINEEQRSGNYSIIWDGKNSIGARVASGTYFYQIHTGDFDQAKKMILLK